MENGLIVGTLRLSNTKRGINLHINVDRIINGIEGYYRNPDGEKIVVICCAVENIEDILNENKKLTPLIYFPSKE